MEPSPRRAGVPRRRRGVRRARRPRAARAAALAAARARMAVPREAGAATLVEALPHHELGVRNDGGGGLDSRARHAGDDAGAAGRRMTMEARPAAAKRTLAYVLAASHSGSTLLAMLLGSHPEVCTVGELKATSLGDPDTYRCSCGALIRDCEVWDGVSRSMAARGHAFDIPRAETHIS